MTITHKIQALKELITLLQHDARANNEKAKQWPAHHYKHYSMIQRNNGLYRAIDVTKHRIKQLKKEL